MNSILSQLHSKYAAKTWNETFQLVRRCMEKPRDDSTPCQPLVGSLQRLQEVFNVSSMNATRSRLEVVAKQQGMGFHLSESTCYLTADLFYLEVALLPGGGVDEVKVAPHRQSPFSSHSLLQPLRSKDFAEFSTKLKDLISQYDIPGDKDVKFQLFTALQHLGKDLQAICQLHRMANDDERYEKDKINDSLFGSVVADKADFPLTIHLYSPPTVDGVNVADVQSAQLAVMSSTRQTHKFAMASVVLLPLQLDPRGFPVLSATSDVAHETFPACFVLRLKPPVPLLRSFVENINHITGVAVPDVDLQWAQFGNLLAQDSKSDCSPEVELDAFFTLPVGGDASHTYVFPGEAWAASRHAGAVMDAVPFTHPAHLPHMVEVLRHQCAVNTLLRSCMSPHPVSDCARHFEVRPEDDVVGFGFSVTFQRPDKDSLATLLVSIPGCQQITCRLFGAEIGASALEDNVAGIIKRCMSIPVGLQALLEKMPRAESSSDLRVPTEDAASSSLLSQSALEKSSTHASPGGAAEAHLPPLTD
ncbi:mediator of RNA polymerase II transcription subunit 1-like [Festucalex cinctus]